MTRRTLLAFSLCPLAVALSACGSDAASELAAQSRPAASVVAPSADTLRRDSAASPVRAAPITPVAEPVATTVPAAPSARSARDTISLRAAIRAGEKASWPELPEPLRGAILPARRIVAYYGNPLSKRMGILGEVPPEEMLARLDREVAAWRAADPGTPVQPALHLVAVVAQGSAGRDGKYRARMDSALIEKVYGWARQRDALLFLDIQVGKSTVQEELPRLLRFLERPNVHLGLDPEFSMHYEREGVPPGKQIGVMRARDIDYVVRTLAKLVEEQQLPPKVLVVHRFTRRMVPDATAIQADPRVQVVMHMDGWGPPWLKFDSYRDYIVAEPVQYTGFKIFYKNDTKKGDALVAPEELVRLRPAPLYIQYQ